MQLISKLTNAAAGVILAAGISSAAQAQLKIGFVYVGPIGDHGWSYEHNQGRLAIEKALGDKAGALPGVGTSPALIKLLKKQFQQMRKDEKYQNKEMTKISSIAKEVFVSRRDVSDEPSVFR